MEGNHNNNFKYKSRFSHSKKSFPRGGKFSKKSNWLLQTPMEHRRDNPGRSRDGTLCNTDNCLLETPMLHRWDNPEISQDSELNRDRYNRSKNSERGWDGEWNLDRPFHEMNHERSRAGERNFGDIDIREQLNKEHPQQSLQQTSSFSAYDYNTSDRSYVDDRRALSMLSACKVIAAITSHLDVNQMDSMSMAQNNLSVNPGSLAVDMAQPSGSGMNPFMGMLGNNSSGIMEMGNYCQYGMMNLPENVMVGHKKEVLRLTKCVLYPPSQNAPPPITREKPLGCKTVFVGGLSEIISEEMIGEIFERCGEIHTILMSKENFCHIRFTSESYVENAMYFSGYRIKIEENGSFIGELHVDYAKTREDELEYENLQRTLQYETRRKERLEHKYSSTDIPSPTVRYSCHDSAVLCEKLRGEETFQQAVLVLITWLERGECNKRNSGSFFSMIQSTNSHVRRLMNEKLKFEDELEKAKQIFQKNMHCILLQFNNIEKVFNAACLQKVWDHFTKAQRKNIELWKKQTEENKNAHVELVLKDRVEDEMDLSDDDCKKENIITNKVLDDSDKAKNPSEEVCRLREENDALRCQLEAAEKKVMVVQSEKVQELDFKERQIQALRQILEGSMKDIKSLSQTRSLDEAELDEICAYKSIRLDKDAEKDDKENLKLDNDNLGAVVSTSSRPNRSFSEKEARVIGLISAFLTVHPFGANLDYICSYLHQIDSAIKASDAENVMKNLSSMFREDSTGVGASLGKKWHFLGFHS